MIIDTIFLKYTNNDCIKSEDYEYVKKDIIRVIEALLPRALSGNELKDDAMFGFNCCLAIIHNNLDGSMGGKDE